jgi:hypothetical protein
MTNDQGAHRMTGHIEHLGRGPDLERLQLPHLVRAQLRRSRSRRRGEGQPAVDEIEERVRETLYGKTYYSGTHKRVHLDVEGGNG